VSARVALQARGGSLVVRRSMTAAQASDDHAASELGAVPVAEVPEPGEHLIGAPIVQPGEVFVVPLDEQRRPGRGPTLGPPRREVARAVAIASGPVDARGVGPDPEVADVQHPGRTPRPGEPRTRAGGRRTDRGLRGCRRRRTAASRTSTAT
jgi:hypothetical protein